MVAVRCFWWSGRQTCLSLWHLTPSACRSVVCWCSLEGGLGLYRIYGFLLVVRNQWGVASCVYGYSWSTRMSKGGVRQTTVDGLPPRLTVYRVATPWLTLAVVCQPLRTLPPRCPSIAECTGMCGIWRCPMAVCARPPLTVYRTYFMSCAIAGQGGLTCLGVLVLCRRVVFAWSFRKLGIQRQ